MKKLLIMMIVINTFVFSNSLSKISSLTAKINEKTVVNKNKKEKSYSFSMKYPDKAYKEMLSPKINVGEKYVYNGKKKLVYYPLLKDKFIEDIDEEENYILQAIKEIKLGKKPMIIENSEVKELNLGDGTSRQRPGLPQLKEGSGSQRMFFVQGNGSGSGGDGFRPFVTAGAEFGNGTVKDGTEVGVIKRGRHVFRLLPGQAQIFRLLERSGCPFIISRAEQAMAQ